MFSSVSFDIYNEFKAASDKYVADQELLKQQVTQKVHDYLVAKIQKDKQKMLETIKSTGKRNFCISVPLDSIPDMGKAGFSQGTVISKWGPFEFFYIETDNGHYVFDICWK